MRTMLATTFSTFGLVSVLPLVSGTKDHGNGKIVH